MSLFAWIFIQYACIRKLFCIRSNFCRVGNSLLRSFLFCSKSLILKSDCERLALLALYKRATMSKSLSLLFSTERCKQMACDLRESNAKKKWFAQKIRIFCMFYTFFPFLCPRANLSLRSLLIRSLKKSKRGRFNKKNEQKGD